MSGFVERWSQQRPGFVRLKISSLCSRDIPVTSNWAAIGWWETRRASFNLIVGSAGIISCVTFGVVGLGDFFLFHGEFPAPNGLTLLAIIFYGVVANLCFTGGWVVEILVRKLWPKEADRFATSSLYVGLLFSTLLTLAPGIVAGAAGVFGLVAHLFGVTHGKL